jgi:hypothetical protein
MLLYHGSNTVISKPDLGMSKKYLDFGMGFYLTSNKNQAVEFSKKVVRRALKRREGAGIATINEYEFETESAKRMLRVKIFDMPDEEWLDYVVSNRQGVGNADDYDVVIGPVANDDVFEVIEYYEDGMFTKEAAINALKIKKLFTQFTMKTEAALNMLKFTEYWQAKETLQEHE